MDIWNFCKKTSYDAVYRLLVPTSETETAALLCYPLLMARQGLYGIDDLRTGFMANHLCGMAIWDTLYEAATLGP